MSTCESDNNPTDQSPWLSPRVVFWTFSLFIIFVLLNLLLPDVDSGPVSTRSQSKNNLKQVGVGIWNFSEAHQQALPPHAIVGPEGNELFGWPVSLLPYLEGQGIYDQLNLDKSWNDPVNQSPTSINFAVLLNPRLDIATSDSGYALSHYAANSRVFHSDKTWSLEEITAKDGLENTMLFGEIEDHFQPWAAPGSLRDPAQGFGNGRDQFGMSENRTVNFVFADGSVKALSPDIDTKILKAMGTPDGGEIIPEQ